MATRTENNPVVIMLAGLGGRLLSAWLESRAFTNERFGSSCLYGEEENRFKARCAGFWDQEWPLLEGSQKEKIRATFQKIDAVLLSPLEAEIEDIRAKMGIPTKKGRKMKRSSEGIDIFLKALKRDLKEKRT